MGLICSDDLTLKQKLGILGIWIFSAFYGIATCFPEKVCSLKWPFTIHGDWWVYRPCPLLCLYNVLGLAFKRFLEPGRVPNYLDKNCASDVQTFSFFLPVYRCRLKLIHEKKYLTLFKFVLCTILNIWKIPCIFVILKLSLQFSGRSDEFRRFRRFIQWGILQSFLIFRNIWLYWLIVYPSGSK